MAGTLNGCAQVCAHVILIFILFDHAWERAPVRLSIKTRHKNDNKERGKHAQKKQNHLSEPLVVALPASYGFRNSLNNIICSFILTEAGPIARDQRTSAHACVHGRCDRT
tara:strand:+ start:94 stop:423 length:330 start_codon:yes stop_codon:yes gene_type:complete